MTGAQRGLLYSPRQHRQTVALGSMQLSRATLSISMISVVHARRRFTVHVGCRSCWEFHFGRLSHIGNYPGRMDLEERGVQDGANMQSAAVELSSPASTAVSLFTT